MLLQDYHRALINLGIAPDEFEAIRRAPYSKAQVLLQALKEKARHNYKKKAFELHPDRTQGDKSKAELFNLLGQALEKINSMIIHSAPPIMQFIPIVTWQQQRYSPKKTINNSHQAKVFRIVTMRPK